MPDSIESVAVYLAGKVSSSEGGNAAFCEEKYVGKRCKRPAFCILLLDEGCVQRHRWAKKASLDVTRARLYIKN